jgi:predicted DCC family thiol-disulfide oxidoreductase YuxK
MSTLYSEEKILIQFDGMCILCNRSIRFILKADRRKRFVFRTLQNSTDNETFDSVIVSDGINIYNHFDAVIKIGKELGGLFKIVAVFRLIPRSYRHSLYLFIAKNRYKWFGMSKSCFLPSTEEQERFI